MANPTALLLVKVVVHKNNTQITADMAPNKFPKTRFMAEPKGYWELRIKGL
tara:strand:+ start:676 stop:828 length:153 start_codon:yes stop_codon:yes gene_type:complete